jgi:hypothetical protein
MNILLQYWLCLICILSLCTLSFTTSTTPTTTKNQLVTFKIDTSGVFTIPITDVNTFQLELNNSTGIGNLCEVVPLSQKLIVDHSIDLNDKETIISFFNINLTLFLITSSNSVLSYSFKPDATSINHALTINNVPQNMTNLTTYYCIDQKMNMIYGINQDGLIAISRSDSMQSRWLPKAFPSDLNIDFTKVTGIVCNNKNIVLAAGEAGAILFNLADIDSEPRYNVIDHDDLEEGNGKVNVVKVHINDDNIVTIYDKLNQKLSWFYLDGVDNIISLLLEENKAIGSVEKLYAGLNNYIIKETNQDNVYTEYKLSTSEHFPSSKSIKLNEIAQYTLEDPPKHTCLLDDYTLFDYESSLQVGSHTYYSLSDSDIKNNEITLFHNRPGITNSYLISSGELTGTRKSFIVSTTNQSVQISELKGLQVQCTVDKSGEYDLHTIQHSTACVGADYCIKEQPYKIQLELTNSSTTTTDNAALPNDIHEEDNLVNVTNATALNESAWNPSGQKENYKLNLDNWVIGLIFFTLVILLAVLLSQCLRYYEAKKQSNLEKEQDMEIHQDLPISAKEKEKEKIEVINKDEYLELDPLEGEDLQNTSHDFDIRNYDEYKPKDDPDTFITDD